MTKMLVRLFFLFAIILLEREVKAQFSDDFLDGEIANNPTWAGDIASWAVENNKLRSNNMVANSSFYLSTMSQLVQNSEWDLIVNLQFNTSGLNYVDIS